MEEKYSFKGKKVIVFDLDGTIVKLDVDWKHLKGILSDEFSKIYSNKCEFNSISHCFTEIVKRDDESTLNDFINIVREFELKNLKTSTPLKETVYLLIILSYLELKKERKWQFFH